MQQTFVQAFSFRTADSLSLSSMWKCQAPTIAFLYLIVAASLHFSLVFLQMPTPAVRMFSMHCSQQPATHLSPFMCCTMGSRIDRLCASLGCATGPMTMPGLTVASSQLQYKAEGNLESSSPSSVTHRPVPSAQDMNSVPPDKTAEDAPCS